MSSRAVAWTRDGMTPTAAAASSGTSSIDVAAIPRSRTFPTRPGKDGPAPPGRFCPTRPGRNDHQDDSSTGCARSDWDGAAGIPVDRIGPPTHAPAVPRFATFRRGGRGIRPHRDRRSLRAPFPPDRVIGSFLIRRIPYVNRRWTVSMNLAAGPGAIHR
jgi:hypothetical protein